MNFDLSEDDTALQDSVSRWVQQRYPFDARRKLAASDTGWSAAHWREMAQMGWLALPFAEAQGGLGGGPLSIALLMEELGKGLVLEPVLPTLLLFGGALQRCPALADAWLPKLIEGQLQGALAIAERDSRYELADVQCTLQRAGDGYVLDGEKALVLNGAAADQLVVVARSSGARFDTQGISLVLVNASAAGVSRTPLRLMDGQRVANIRFDQVAVPASQLLCAEGDGHALLRQVVQDATLALCAEGLRRDAAAVRHHARIREDTQAVRRAHRQLPGAAAPAGGHVRGAGTDPLAAVPRGVLGAGPAGRSRARHRRAEGHGRQGAAG